MGENKKALILLAYGLAMYGFGLFTGFLAA